MLYTFVDTNTFLHYQSLPDIDLSKIFGSEVNTVVFSQTVIKELEKHKFGHKNKKIRNRAIEALKKIEIWCATGKFAGKTQAILFAGKPDPILFDDDLDREVADDRLIAEALTFSRSKSGDTVAILTNDTVLRLKASSRNLRSERIGDDFLLASEPDYETKLKEEIQQLKNLQPKPSLSFDGDRSQLTFKLAEYVKPTDADLNDFMEKVKSRHPLRQNGNRQIGGVPHALSEEAAKNLLSMFDSFAQTSLVEHGRYNDDVLRFYTDCEKYFWEKAKFDELINRTLKIEIILKNTGTKPAENLDIFMHFPDGFRLIDLSDIESEPESPAPPKQPMSPLEQLSRNLSFNVSPLVSPSMLNFDRTPHNISSPKIVRSNSYDVNVHVRKIKHGENLLLDPMVIIFDSVVSAGSFRVDYSISADNLPKHYSSSLNFIRE